ncbi:MAG: hypothetical protein NUV98_05230, partial [Candidatus Roizmanbacteria bacterium]|nr:hypothetical protein [Candidatus Roizmanbacteria bacterium]
PGQTSTPHVVFLKNVNSGAALAITAAATAVSGSLSADDITVTIEARNPDGTDLPDAPVTQSLSAWATPTALGTPNIPDNGEQRYHVTASVAGTVTTSGASTGFNLVFTGTQL